MATSVANCFRHSGFCVANEGTACEPDEREAEVILAGLRDALEDPPSGLHGSFEFEDYRYHRHSSNKSKKCSHFIFVLSDRKLSETLQLDANLSLTMALTKARQKESVHKQQQQLLRASEEPSSLKRESTRLDAVSHNHRGKGKNLPRLHNNATKSSNQSCGYCGGLPHSHSLCPAD
ncbi:hypothetical protein MTO96_051437 [Rhipicephalus appendiculatus]